MIGLSKMCITFFDLFSPVYAASEMIVYIKVVVCIIFQGLNNILQVKLDEKFIVITLHLVLHRRWCWFNGFILPDGASLDFGEMYFFLKEHILIILVMRKSGHVWYYCYSYSYKSKLSPQKYKSVMPGDMSQHSNASLPQVQDAIPRLTGGCNPENQWMPTLNHSKFLFVRV